MRKLWILVPLLALALSGCAESAAGKGVATANGNKANNNATSGEQVSGDNEERRRQFTQCMRDHGMDMPDIDANGAVGGGIAKAGEGDKGVTKEKAEAAMEACKKYLPNGGEPPKLTPEEQEQMRKFAQCMRDHGVDMPDPDADTGGIKVEARPGTGGGAGGTTDKIGGLDDPTFKSAFEACKSNLPKGGNNK